MKYQSGFGNDFATEAIPGALPQGQNSPQKPPLGLYAEQLSGTAFTVPNRENLRSWLYRIRPSVLHDEFRKTPFPYFLTHPDPHMTWTPNQQRWGALPMPAGKLDFLEGIRTYVANGSVSNGSGCAVHLYVCTAEMKDRYFMNSDGEFLIVPQDGDLEIRTELGTLDIKPGDIASVPRGVKYQVNPKTKKARGYICENYGAPFRIPERGPIGANGLANGRDFLAPVADYEDKSGKFQLINKFQGEFWSTFLSHSPLDVVAWHGTYTPYKYDLRRFNTIGSISFDHPDPSIFTVLTSPSSDRGIANIDFVIFPRRWMVAENTFRPPYYHRNIMSEFMGLVYGIYDAKEKSFEPGGASLHNCMSAHDPEAAVFEKATHQILKPELYDSTLAFMFESRFPFGITPFAMKLPQRQKNYPQCWKGLKSHFSPPKT